EAYSAGPGTRVLLRDGRQCGGEADGRRNRDGWPLRRVLRRTGEGEPDRQQGREHGVSLIDFRLQAEERRRWRPALRERAFAIRVASGDFVSVSIGCGS